MHWLRTWLNRSLFPRSSLPVARLYSWSRTAAHYREQGYLVEKAEYTARGRRHDLMGFVDGIAFGIGHTVYLQACGKDWTEHVDKITTDCRAKAVRVLMAGNQIHLVGWRKLKQKRGGKAVRWTPRIREFSLDDFSPGA